MNFFGIGLPEMILIMVVALLIFGPKKLPEIGRSVGKAIKGFQDASNDFQSEFKREAELLEQVKSLPNKIMNPSAANLFSQPIDDPETNLPETNIQETNIPETNIPETNIQETRSHDSESDLIESTNALSDNSENTENIIGINSEIKAEAVEHIDEQPENKNSTNENVAAIASQVST